MNTKPQRKAPKSDYEIVNDLIAWANRWSADQKPSRLGKARRKVQLWDVIESAAKQRVTSFGGMRLEYIEKPTPVLEILNEGIAGSMFTQEEAEELCARIMERATKPSGQNA